MAATLIGDLVRRPLPMSWSRAPSSSRSGRETWVVSVALVRLDGGQGDASTASGSSVSSRTPPSPGVSRDAEGPGPRDRYPTVQNFCLALRSLGVGSAITTFLGAAEPQVRELRQAGAGGGGAHPQHQAGV